MQEHVREKGAALILLLGMIAALAIFCVTLVFVIANQQKATAKVRSDKQSLYLAEGALDTGVRLAKINKVMSTTSEWLTPEELEAAFASAGFPSGADVSYKVYDNLAAVDYDIKWDQGGPSSPATPDGRVWVEATVTYKGATKRVRVLVQQAQKPFAEALPKAVTYSDTGIKLNDSSDIYAVNEDGTPDTSGSPYVTSITAGGTWTTSTPSSQAEIGRFTMNTSADLAAPGTTTQSLGITVNGSVRIGGTTFNSAPSGTISAGGHTFDDVVIQPGVVGYLSDYFDQAAQVSLQNESMAGGTPATAPTAPAGWSSVGFTTLSGTTLSTVTSTSSTTTFNAAYDYVYSGNLTINRNGNTGRTLNFRRLYVSGNLSIQGPASVNCADLYVGGTLTINNTRATVATDSFGPLYVAGTGSSSLSGSVMVTSGPTYFGGTFTASNTTTTATADTFGGLYCVGALSISGNLETSGTSLYGGGNITFTGPSSGIKTHRYPLVYANSTSSTTTLSGNVQLYSSETTLNGNFTISGATGTTVKDWLGHLYVKARPTSGTGDIKWSGTASVTSRDYQNPAADPKPMWMGEYWSRTGTYNDEYGCVWVPGNSSTSVVFGSTGASTMMCPLLCTTEKCTWSGNVTYGTRTQPMTFFFMCDNNGIYPQVFEYSGTGTFYGLMVINESTADFSNGVAGKPSVQGGVFAGCPYDPTYTSGMSMSDIVLNDGSSIAYDKSVVGAIATSSLKTTILVTETVPGSWQELPAN